MALSHIDALSGVLSLLGHHGARVEAPLAGPELTIEAVLPSALVRDLRRALPTLMRGKGVLESRLIGYEPVTASLRLVAGRHPIL